MPLPGDEKSENLKTSSIKQLVRELINRLWRQPAGNRQTKGLLAALQAYNSNEPILDPDAVNIPHDIKPAFDQTLTPERISEFFQNRMRYTDFGKEFTIYLSSTRLTEQEASKLNQSKHRIISRTVLIKESKGGQDRGVDNNELLSRDAKMSIAPGIEPFAVATSSLQTVERGNPYLIFEKGMGTFLSEGEKIREFQPEQIARIFYQFCVVGEAFHVQDAFFADVGYDFSYWGVEMMKLRHQSVETIQFEDLSYHEKLPEKGVERGIKVIDDVQKRAHILATMLLPKLNEIARVEAEKWLNLMREDTFQSFAMIAQTIDQLRYNQFSNEYQVLIGNKPPDAHMGKISAEERTQAVEKYKELLAKQQVSQPKT